MAPHRAPRRTLIAAVLAAVVLIAGCGGSDEDEGGGVPESGTLPSTTTTEPTDGSGATTTTAQTRGTTATTDLPAGVEALVDIDVHGDAVSVNSVVGGNNPSFERDVQVGVNTPVRIQVTADRSDEAHLHGYDLKADLEPGVAGVIDFVADTPGIFLIELEGNHLLLAQLEVVT